MIIDLFDIEMTEDGEMNCTILEYVNFRMHLARVEWQDSNRFAARFNDELDGFGTWANATNMEQLFGFFRKLTFTRSIFISSRRENVSERTQA